MQPEYPTDEIKRLQRCINDLVSLLALPAIWRGGDSLQIVRTLLDVLSSMLHLDFAYVRLRDPAGGSPIEMSRVAASRNLPTRPEEIRALLDHALGPDQQKWAPRARCTFGDFDMSIVPLRLAFQDEIGVIVAGSQRVGFPGQTESLVMSVAANQAAIGLQEARSLGEQKRVANELDCRVAERTAELAAANEELERQVAERKRAEERIRASERNLRQTIDTIPALAWSAYPDGSAEFLNQYYLDYVRLSQEQAQGWGWTVAVHPEDVKGLTVAWQRVMASDEPGEYEARLRRFDGEYRWFLFRANALRDDDGNIIKWYGVNTDIEDRKRAEEKARLIIDTALDAVVTMNAQGSVTTWNKQAETMFGWSNEEAIGQHLADMIIPPQHRMAHTRGMRHFLATGDGPILGRRVEITAVRRSAGEFPVELEVVPMRLGQDWIFSAFIRDITDSKLAQEKLRESELNLRQLTETIPEMLWSATPEGKVDYCNARLLDYTGFRAEEVMGVNWTKLLHPDDVDQTVRTWISCVASGAPYRVEVRTYHAVDQTYRWCVTNARALLDQQGRVLKWHGTVVDMHDWKQAQEALRNTQTELAHIGRVMTMGVLTASIAHEVNQPLSGIVTNASTCMRMLAADPPDIEGARETARRTIRDGNRASEVIARLRALYAKKSASTEPVDLNEAAREVIALSSNQLQKNRVLLQTELADGLPSITGDRVQLQQVILNLLLNAADAMHDVGDRQRKLLIRTEPDDGDCVRLTVRDSGVGIESQSIDKVFEPFYTTKNDGMGIGLSVSRAIVESHHGRLWAAPNDGPGATFSFSIPR